MALGGVATGNMKEKLDAKVAGIMSKSGCKLSDKATSASKGRKSVAVAAFAVNSVMMFMITATTSGSRTYGTK
jgi:hypothetical protein